MGGCHGTWQWLGSQWHDYPPGDGEKLSRLRARGAGAAQEPITLSHSDEFTYVFDFAEMQQRNTATGKVRQIRYVPSAQPPDQRVRMQGQAAPGPPPGQARMARLAGPAQPAGAAPRRAAQQGALRECRAPSPAGAASPSPPHQVIMARLADPAQPPAAAPWRAARERMAWLAGPAQPPGAAVCPPLPGAPLWAADWWADAQRQRPPAAPAAADRGGAPAPLPCPVAPPAAMNRSRTAFPPPPAPHAASPTRRSCPPGPQQGRRPASRSPGRSAALCDTCMAPYTRKAYFSRACSCRCCHECAQTLVRAALEDGTKRFTALQCPCQNLIPWKQLRGIAQPEDFRRIEELTQDAEYVHCTAPGCGRGQLHDCTGGQIMTCYKCSSRTCAACKVPWHDGMKCAEYRRMRDSAGGARTRRLGSGELGEHEAGVKRCPKCDMLWAKDEGCDIATCSNCQYKFCWTCLCDMRPVLQGRTGGNHHHKRDCRHWRPAQ
eukprot:TRINITY_DN5794_c1_g2_i2.p1 TRINITY_DN5794_c1_g2~~TRINITY_DN5794_c1_g2_i2.p1  ORF type:complete len:524 (+),score=60.21 TRINITY_DN5794_c1_g2_i2:100-1572(+)